MDSNRPEAWRIIDTNEPRAIVGTYPTYAEAYRLCNELEPVSTRDSGGNWRFILEPVRHA